MLFIPPYCPNPDCFHFHGKDEANSIWFYRHGTRLTQAFGRVQQFRCRVCKHAFSQNVFSPHYRTKRLVNLENLRNLLVSCGGIRQIGRTLGLSHKVIANRYARLARQSLALLARARQQLAVAEDFVFDGFESFTDSQYFPNNTNLLLGKNSGYLYGFNHVFLRRKGAMTAAQKEKRALFEKKWIAPPRHSLLRSQEMFHFAMLRRFDALTLPVTFFTDKHKAYPWALKTLGAPFRHWKEAQVIFQDQTDSTAPRTPQNPLFQANYADRQIRKDQAEHVRETVRFGRRVERALERMAIYLAYHNFWKPYRIQGENSQTTHAVKAGIDPLWLQQEKARSWTERAVGNREELEPWELRIWNREDKIPLFPSAPLPACLRAG